LLNDFYKLSIILSFNTALLFPSSPVANVEFCDLCHGRLRYVNFNTVERRMMHLNLIFKSHINKKYI